MSKTLLNIKIHYDEFSKTEKKIADFLMQNPDCILPLFITELAEKCGTSEATVVRFAKRLGFDGYQQLKIAIAQESNVRPVSENITRQDDSFDIFSKVCRDIYCSLEKTKQAVDKQALQACCDSLRSADKILVFGLGNSASVALDTAHKMFRLGLSSRIAQLAIIDTIYSYLVCHIDGANDKIAQTELALKAKKV